jgi:hypothetical protein
MKTKPNNSTATDSRPSPGYADRPRSFDVGGLLAFVAVYGLVLGVLSAFGPGPLVLAPAALFLVAVFAGQFFLFGGRKPREAAVAAGAGLGIAYSTAAAVVLHLTGEDYYGWVVSGWVVLAPAIGAVLGFVCGTVNAALLAAVERPGRRPRRPGKAAGG